MLPLLGPIATCYVRLHGTTTVLALVVYSLKLVKCLAQQIPIFLFFSNRRNLADFAWNHNYWLRENVCTCTLQGSQYLFRQPPQILHSFEFTTHQVPASANKSQHYWANNVVTCCVHLHAPHDNTDFRKHNDVRQQFFCKRNYFSFEVLLVSLQTLVQKQALIMKGTKSRDAACS